MEAASPVKEEYGPALPDLLGRRVRRPRALIVGVTAAILAITGAVYVAGLGNNDVRVVHRSPPPVFNLRYANVLKAVAPDPGGVLKLEGRRGGLFLQSFAVRPIRLPPYRGSITGLLPEYATRYVGVLAHRYRGFVALDEGKARVNAIPGYYVAFRARLGTRTLWGRDVLLFPDQPGAREGAILTLLQTPAAGATKPADVGTIGALKKPFRSFRFGTSTTGGQ